MIIAVNTRLLITDKLEGIGKFTYETLKIITTRHPEHHFIFIFDRKYDNEFIFSANITPVIGFPPARHPFLWYLFFEKSIPSLLKKYKADMFLSPDGWLSLNTGIKSLPVIHDLNFFHFPEFIPFLTREYYNYFFPKFIQKSQRIATVSQFSRNDIINRFHYDENLIDVVYNGTADFKPIDDFKKQQTRDRYCLGNPYFLFVGLIHPRKNLENLMLAYDKFREKTDSHVKLLVVGERKWWAHSLQDAYEQCRFQNDIIFTGRLPEDELRNIMPQRSVLLMYLILRDLVFLFWNP